MQAVTYLGPHDVRVLEAPEPTPESGEVVLRNRYVAICRTDALTVRGRMRAAVPPRVLGHEAGSVIETVSSEAAEMGFAPGQSVTVLPTQHCNRCPCCGDGHYHLCIHPTLIGLDVDGLMAAFQRVPARNLALLPEGFDLRLAVLVELVAAAWHGLDQADWQARPRSVMVNSAFPIGLATALTARCWKGVRPVVVEAHPKRRALAEQLGLTTVDSSQSDWVAAALEATGEEGADLLLESTGNAAGCETMIDLVRPQGQVVIQHKFEEPASVNLERALRNEITIRSACLYRTPAFPQIIELIQRHSDAYATLLTAEYSLDRAVEAFAADWQQTTGGKTLLRC